VKSDDLLSCDLESWKSRTQLRIIIELKVKVKRATLLVQFVDLPRPLDEPLLHSEKSVREEFRRISEKFLKSF